MNVEDIVKTYDVGYILSKCLTYEKRGGWSFTRYKEVSKYKPLRVVLLGKVLLDDEWHFVICNHNSIAFYKNVYSSLEEAEEECERKNNENSAHN
jgi:hypothetical protein